MIRINIRPLFQSRSRERGSRERTQTRSWLKLLSLGNTILFKRSPGDPIRDSDSLSFKADGPRLNRVHFILDLGGVLIFTEEGEIFLEGQGNGIVTPSEITPKFQSYNGSSPGVAPVVIDNTAVYLQRTGSVIRELGYSFDSDGYRGNDLTTFGGHLFADFTVVA